MTLKRKLLNGAVLLFLLGGGYLWWRSVQKPVILPTEEVARGTVSETVSITGEVVPERYADLSFKTGGVVEEVWVKEGERVKAGDPLLRLDQVTLLEELRAAEANLAIVEANERLARRNWAALAPEERQAKIFSSEKARAEATLIKRELADRVQRAPFAGKVTRINRHVGEVAAMNEVLIRIVGDQADGSVPFKIQAQIPESDITKVQAGMRAQVTFDALTRDDAFQVVVRELESSATVAQDVVSYVGTFDFEGMPDLRLRDGMTANIDIETSRKEQVLVLPFRSIVRENGKYFVEVREGDAFVKREVKIGLEGDDGDVEIVSGVQEHDEVTLAPKSQ